MCFIINQDQKEVTYCYMIFYQNIQLRKLSLWQQMKHGSDRFCRHQSGQSWLVFNPKKTNVINVNRTKTVILNHNL
jgi:hypothetical protein